MTAGVGVDVVPEKDEEVRIGCNDGVPDRLVLVLPGASADGDASQQAVADGVGFAGAARGAAAADDARRRRTPGPAAG